MTSLKNSGKHIFVFTVPESEVYDRLESIKQEYRVCPICGSDAIDIAIEKKNGDVDITVICLESVRQADKKKKNKGGLK